MDEPYNIPADAVSEVVREHVLNIVTAHNSKSLETAIFSGAFSNREIDVLAPDDPTKGILHGTIMCGLKGQTQVLVRDGDLDVIESLYTILRYRGINRDQLPTRVSVRGFGTIGDIMQVSCNACTAGAASCWVAGE